MKNLLYLALFSMIFITACGDDDDGTGGSGGADGDLRVTLTWDQADADLDLNLLGPNNLIVGAGDSRHSGDDLSGPGDEEIFFMDSAADGAYTVIVSHFEGVGDVSYRLVIESAGTTRTIDETISAAADIDNTTFTKAGSTLNF